MNDLIFATPFWLPLCIIGVGVLLFISGNKRQQSRVRWAGIGVVGLAVVLITVSYLVETDKEKVDRHMHELVASVENRDWPKMKTLLSDDASLRTVNMTIYPNRAALLTGAADAADQYQLKSVTITSMQTEQVQTLITVDLNVLTMQDATMGRPVPSGWQFEWEKAGDDWSLSRITCVSVGNQKLDEIRTLFPK
jgi:hypothetical protein